LLSGSTDRVLFVIDHAAHELAVVHLTWRMKPESDPALPSTQLFNDQDQWIRECMKPDHVGFARSEPQHESVSQDLEARVRSEVITWHARGIPPSAILASFDDVACQLTAANVLAGLPDLRRARRWRLVTWFLALFFAICASIELVWLINNGVSLPSLISLAANGSICVSLVRFEVRD